MLHQFARTPLLLKLIVADAVVNVFAFVVMQRLPPTVAERVMLLSLFGVLVFNAGLVAWALAPLRVLEDTARRVSQGEIAARVQMPWLADRNLTRIGDTFNGLLGRLQAERDRVRLLASLVVATGDTERSRIARELHDGTAQSLSALDMLLASTLAEGQAGAVEDRLKLMQNIVGEALMEVRGLAQGLHPRVLDDLGLVAALEQLARHSRIARQVEIVVHKEVEGQLPPTHAAVLYRVAQEALHNAVKHSEATRIDIYLRSARGIAEVRVRDNGRGFEAGQTSSAGGAGMGLFVMEERVSLVDGSFSFRTSRGQGTEVIASVPIPTGPDAAAGSTEARASPAARSPAPLEGRRSVASVEELR